MDNGETSLEFVNPMTPGIIGHEKVMGRERTAMRAHQGNFQRRGADGDGDMLGKAGG